MRPREVSGRTAALTCYAALQTLEGAVDLCLSEGAEVVIHWLVQGGVGGVLPFEPKVNKIWQTWHRTYYGEGSAGGTRRSSPVWIICALCNPEGHVPEVLA